MLALIEIAFMLANECGDLSAPLLLARTPRRAPGDGCPARDARRNRSTLTRSPTSAGYLCAAAKTPAAVGQKPLLSASRRPPARSPGIYPGLRRWPFPCLIDVHGGGWLRSDLENRNGIGQYAGHTGCVIVSLNFRQGADA